MTPTSTLATAAPASYSTTLAPVNLRFNVLMSRNPYIFCENTDLNPGEVYW